MLRSVLLYPWPAGLGKMVRQPGKLLRHRPIYRKKALMQISKSFLVVCAAAYCVALLPLRAADADSELKLREALEKKLNELQTQPAPATAPTAVAAPNLRSKPLRRQSRRQPLPLRPRGRWWPPRGVLRRPTPHPPRPLPGVPHRRPNGPPPPLQPCGPGRP